jgi:hypothetical protein
MTDVNSNQMSFLICLRRVIMFPRKGHNDEMNHFKQTPMRHVSALRLCGGWKWNGNIHSFAPNSAVKQVSLQHQG